MNAAAVLASPGETLPELLKRELCNLVAKQSPTIFFPTLASQSVIVACALGVVPGLWLAAWLAGIGAVHVARLTLLRRTLLAQHLDLERRIRFAVLLSVVSGVVHGASVVFLPFMSLYVQAIQTVVLLGLCAGCVAVNAGHFGIIVGFTTPITTALAVFWLSKVEATGSWEVGAVAALILLFTLSLIFVSRDTYRTFAQSIAIRQENLELARQLEAALRDAEAASRAKTRFLAAASHDLRQPLHTLSFLTAALELRPLDAKGRDILQKMVHALEDLSSEFDMLLDISKLDAGVVTVAPSTFELDAFLARISHPFAVLAEARGVAFETHCPPQVHVKTDRALLERILRNLLDNAFKYSPSGAVRVIAQAEGGHCAVAVSDTGIGIAPSEQERVFEEFYQIDNPERDRRKGLGLGLPIVRRLALLLDLRLEMTSAPGSGTTFRMTLPIEAPLAQAESAPKAGAAVFRDKQFLVIDDEAASREAMQGYLEALGCQVSIAATINEATALAQVQEPDLVVADFRLRGSETGLQAIEALRKTRPGLPALLITGDTAPEKLAQMAAARIPLLHKPVSPALLIDNIASLLAAP